MHFRNRADGRARVFGGGFLVDGNGGRKSVDGIDVRLVHLTQKQARIARKRFDIPPLAFCINGIKSQRRFSAARKPRHDDHLVARKRNGYIFQVMDANALYVDSVVHGWFLSVRRVVGGKKFQRLALPLGELSPKVTERDFTFICKKVHQGNSALTGSCCQSV